MNGSAPPSRRLLVTGASGFIGRHCLRRLAGDGEIHAASRSPPDMPGVVWHAADLSRPAEAAALIAEIRPTHLLHLAWIATPGIYASAPENLDWLEAGLAMLRAFGELGGGEHGGRRFVGLGTSYEYAPTDGPCREDTTPTLPVTLYGKCKLALATAALAAGQRHGFAVAWGRLFVPYGPGDAAARLVPSAAAALSAGQEIKTSEGSQLRDFIYAPDAADLLIRLLLSEETGLFNIGSGEAVTVRSVIDRVAGHYAAEALVRRGAIPTRPGEPQILLADMGKARARLGWAGSTPFDQGLAATLAELERKT